MVDFKLFQIISFSYSIPCDRCLASVTTSLAVALISPSEFLAIQEYDP